MGGRQNVLSSVRRHNLISNGARFTRMMWGYQTVLPLVTVIGELKCPLLGLLVGWLGGWVAAPLAGLSDLSGFLALGGCA